MYLDPDRVYPFPEVDTVGRRFKVYKHPQSPHWVIVDPHLQVEVAQANHLILGTPRLVATLRPLRWFSGWISRSLNAYIEGTILYVSDEGQPTRSVVKSLFRSAAGRLVQPAPPVCGVQLKLSKETFVSDQYPEGVPSYPVLAVLEEGKNIRLYYPEMPGRKD